jgi:putative hydrolase of the HAD superfamily
MAIKAIFFDAAGTLIKPIRPVGQSYALVAAKYGMNLSSEQISERFRVCFESSPPLAFGPVSSEPIEQLERNWWKQLVRCVFEPLGRFERFDDFFAELFSYFAQAEAWELYSDVLETLSALENRDLVVDVISNFDSRLIGILQGLGIAHRFEEVFISSRVGYAKPARQIFDEALARHGLAPHEAMHVGDSIESDLCGAVNAGLTGVLIDRSSETPWNGSGRVKTLREILQILERASKIESNA